MSWSPGVGSLRVSGYRRDGASQAPATVLCFTVQPGGSTSPPPGPKTSQGRGVHRRLRWAMPWATPPPAGLPAGAPFGRPCVPGPSSPLVRRPKPKPPPRIAHDGRATDTVVGPGEVGDAV